MTQPLGYIGFEFGDDDMFVQQMLDEKRANTEQVKMLDQQKKMLECTETMPENEEPVPTKSLDFEEAFSSDSLPDGYNSPYKNIAFLKDDVVTVNTMSHCPPDDIAKLIRNIQNSVYTLGLDEARQCRRGKLLNVLKSTESATPSVMQQSTPATSSKSTRN
uniref:CACTA en-spm transposon protein n=1 Tax=Caenorhabditis tropicalis TaxID=1561998 RepID=A0A1I7UHM3_9PELO